MGRHITGVTSALTKPKVMSFYSSLNTQNYPQIPTGCALIWVWYSYRSQSDWTGCDSSMMETVNWPSRCVRAAIDSAERELKGRRFYKCITPALLIHIDRGIVAIIWGEHYRTYELIKCSIQHFWNALGECIFFTSFILTVSPCFLCLHSFSPFPSFSCCLLISSPVFCQSCPWLFSPAVFPCSACINSLSRGIFVFVVFSSLNSLDGFSSVSCFFWFSSFLSFLSFIFVRPGLVVLWSLLFWFLLNLGSTTRHPGLKKKVYWLFLWFKTIQKVDKNSGNNVTNGQLLRWILLFSSIKRNVDTCFMNSVSCLWLYK